MYIYPHYSLNELKQLVIKTCFSQIRQRIQMIILAQEGKHRDFIAKHSGCAQTLVDYWVKRYNQEGLDGLKNRPQKV